jgi:hypothetical protein
MSPAAAHSRECLLTTTSKRLKHNKGREPTGEESTDLLREALRKEKENKTQEQQELGLLHRLPSGERTAQMHQFFFNKFRLGVYVRVEYLCIALHIYLAEVACVCDVCAYVSMSHIHKHVRCCMYAGCRVSCHGAP